MLPPRLCARGGSSRRVRGSCLHVPRPSPMGSEGQYPGAGRRRRPGCAPARGLFRGTATQGSSSVSASVYWSSVSTPPPCWAHGGESSTTLQAVSPTSAVSMVVEGVSRRPAVQAAEGRSLVQAVPPLRAGEGQRRRGCPASCLGGPAVQRARGTPQGPVAVGQAAPGCTTARSVNSALRPCVTSGRKGMRSAAPRDSRGHGRPSGPRRAAGSARLYRGEAAIGRRAAM